MIIKPFKKSIQLKVGIYGTGMSGKTAFIKSLLDLFGKEVFSNESSINRTMICDYGTLIVPIDKWKMKVHIFSTAGADYYEVTRPIILSGCDGIIFIVDSQKDVWDRNIKSWNELTNYFKNTINVIPKVIAFNKNDLSFKLNQAAFLKKIKSRNLKNIETVETMAIRGEGVLEAFEKVLDLIIKELNVFEIMNSLIEHKVSISHF